MRSTFPIRGMHCQACTERIGAALRRVPGVTGARVRLEPPTAEIDSDRPIPRESLAAAVRSAGDYTLADTNDDAAARPSAGVQAAHTEHSTTAAPTGAEPRPSLYPLVLIVLYIAGAAALTTLLRAPRPPHALQSLHTFLNDFMAGFFLVFSFFKLLDLRAFASIYRTYDLVARAWRPWGYLYPFIELSLGIAFLARLAPALANSITLALMLIGAAGVARALARKDAVRCACLGGALNLPMTTVTLAEDLLMGAMGALMLLWTG